MVLWVVVGMVVVAGALGMVVVVVVRGHFKGRE